MRRPNEIADTNTSGADVLAVLCELISGCRDDIKVAESAARLNRWPADIMAKYEHATNNLPKYETARTSVAALIEREAALSDELTVCRHKLTGVDVLTKLVESLRTECVQAESERDALAAEVKAQAKQIADFDGLTRAWRLHCNSMKENEDRYLWLKARMDAGMIQMIVNIEPDDKDEISQQVEASIDAARASAATGGGNG